MKNVKEMKRINYLGTKAERQKAQQLQQWDKNADLQGFGIFCFNWFLEKRGKYLVVRG
jgi:hypothetical protein